MPFYHPDHTFRGMLLVGFLLFFNSDVRAQSMVERFERIDHNRDGKVTAEEAGNAEWFKRILDRFDENKDGMLQQTEVSGRAGGNAGNLRQNSEYAAPPVAPHKSLLNVPYDQVEGVDVNLLSLDLYVPEEETGQPRPVMIMIHGGGWRGGDKANPAIVGAKMAHFVSRGYIYASINYRLAPEKPSTPGIKHPTQVQDCANAIAWIHNNIAKHGGDPDQIHLMGHSAGAHLAGLVGTNERFLKNAGKELSIIKTNVLLDTAAIDVPRYIQMNKSRAMTGLFDHVFGSTEEARIDASPHQHIEKGKPLPPTIIFYSGGRMNLKVLAPAFAAAMNEVGVAAKAIDTVTLDHGQVNSRVGLVGEPMTKLIMKLHAGEDASQFPDSIGPKLSPEEAKRRLDEASAATRLKRAQRREMLNKRRQQ